MLPRSHQDLPRGALLTVWGIGCPGFVWSVTESGPRVQKGLGRRDAGYKALKVKGNHI